MGNTQHAFNHKSHAESSKASPDAIASPWVGAPGNRVAVRVTEQGKIEVAGELSVPPAASQRVIIEYLPHFEERVRKSLRRAPLLTVADVAARLKVGEDWVRRHSRKLGAVALGEGRGNDLRFVPDRIESFIVRRSHK
jgi:hypothetical protein